MAGNGATGNMLMGGGSLTSAPEKDVMCKAFRTEVNAWCKLTPDQRQSQSFNDRYFRTLARTPPNGRALASQMTREVAAIFGRGASTVGSTGARMALAQDLATAGASAGRAGAIARQMLAAGSGLLGVATGTSRVAPGALDAARFASRQAFWRAQGVNPNIWPQIAQLRRSGQSLPGSILGQLRRARFYPRYADAMYNGRVVELKSPGDTFRNEAQARDAQTMSGGQDPYVVSCESCGLRCRAGCPKTHPIPTVP